MKNFFFVYICFSIFWIKKMNVLFFIFFFDVKKFCYEILVLGEIFVF